MGSYGSQNFYTLLLPQITFVPFKLFLKFLLSCPHKSTVLDFCNFEFLMFQDFFCSFLLTWDPMGAKTLKRYSSLKSLLNPFKLFLNFLPSSPPKSTVLNFCNFEGFLFFRIFFFPFSLKWDPTGAKISKRYSSLIFISNFEFFQPFPKFSSQWS